jgi:membrane protease YdiL (CAAX protease family)
VFVRGDRFEVIFRSLFSLKSAAGELNRWAVEPGGKIFCFLEDKMTKTNPSLQPLPFRQACVLFGIPAIGLVVVHYLLYPYLKSLNISPNIAFTIQNFIFMGSLILAAYIGIFREGNTASWKDIFARWRIKPMTGQDANWMTVGLFLTFLLQVGVSAIFNPLIEKVMANMGWAISSDAGYDLDRTSLLSVSLLAISLILNIVGEELWWRGYILPRQELQHGQWAWLIHGTMWALFHISRPWEIPGKLFVAQVIPFIVQRRKNTSISLLMHMLMNVFNIVFNFTG